MTIRTKTLGNLKTIFNEWFYTKTETDAKINSLKTAIESLHEFQIEIVDSLPEEGEEYIIYLVLKEETSENNYFDEYLYISSGWELIGNTQTELDLSAYVTLTDFEALKTDYTGHTHDDRYYTKAEVDSTFIKQSDITDTGE